MNLAIDAGNSFLKCTTMSNGSIIDIFRWEYADFFKNGYQKPALNAIICNVSKYDSRDILSRLNYQHVLEFNHSTKIPIKIAYETPKTLGLDRIAACVGAERMNPHVNKLIFDLGTALTIDFIDSNSTFIGGNISLGLNSRFKALHEFTRNLPLLHATNNEVSLIGKDTNSAIVNGVINGIIYEINQYLDNYTIEYQSITPIITGGDCLFFEKRIKRPIFAYPNLTAIGLFSILEHNEK